MRPPLRAGSMSMTKRREGPNNLEGVLLVKKTDQKTSIKLSMKRGAAGLLFELFAHPCFICFGGASTNIWSPHALFGICCFLATCWSSGFWTPCLSGSKGLHSNNHTISRKVKHGNITFPLKHLQHPAKPTRNIN